MQRRQSRAMHQTAANNTGRRRHQKSFTYDRNWDVTGQIRAVGREEMWTGTSTGQGSGQVLVWTFISQLV